jgi:poly(beta-D-mannuronate) lyase
MIKVFRKMIQTKNTRHIQRFLMISIALLSMISCKQGQNLTVKDVNEMVQALAVVQPGGKIILANGVWKNAELLLNAKGTEEAPIRITAEEKGKVFIEGLSNLRISGEYLEISGLVLRNGNTPTGEAISFHEKDGIYANHCRLTECVIDNFNNCERFETEIWVALYGKNNRVDHCYLVDKRSQGVAMAVHLVDKACQENNHHIDHNYFGFRQNRDQWGRNDAPGTSANSLSISGSLVEANYFEHCNGEQEIISTKAAAMYFAIILLGM